MNRTITCNYLRYMLFLLVDKYSTYYWELFKIDFNLWLQLEDKLIGRLPVGIGGSKNKKGKKKGGRRSSRPSSALSDTGTF